MKKYILVLAAVIVLGFCVGTYLFLKSDSSSNSQPLPIPGIKTTGGAGGLDGSLDFSDGSVTVLSPNGGESYKAGEQMVVKWQTKNVGSGNNIWIHLDTVDGKHLNNGDLVVSHVPNTGEKIVAIPSDIPAGQYKVVVTVGQELEDLSDGYVTITSVVTLPTLTQELAQSLVLKVWGGCDPSTCSSVAVTVQGNTVTAIYEGLRDDSASSQKKVAIASYTNNIWVLGEATVTQTCQPGRGHQDFSSVPCI